MTIIDMATITSKGQVTIPQRVRKLLKLQEGASVAFGISKAGVFLIPCEMQMRSPYSEKEWQKIEKLATEKGKSLSNGGEAKAHLKDL
ncbi:MAG: AbrB/MazE/SpoVT family DNA-binding domain-containing protein [Candidatus Omnitrophota bacterium]